MVTFKKPGTGIKSNEIKKIIGKVLKKDILAQNYYVFFDQDEIMGGVTVDENIDTAYKNIKWKNNCFYTIHRLVVKHNRWGNGIGKKLMCFAEELAKKNNKKYIYLGTCYGRDSLYKVRDFKGIEYFDGNKWIDDIEKLKSICKIDPK